MKEVYPLPEPSIVDKWDKEWMLYLLTEAKAPHLVRFDELKVVSDISGCDRNDVFHTSLTRFIDENKANGDLRIWVEGDQIVEKNVAEIGCGSGFLGKQLGFITANYLGIDVSQIAIAICRGNSPSNCTYYWLGQRDKIYEEFGKYDAVVGREFFIHQNYKNVLWVVNLAAHLLKDGGELCADFYLPNYEISQGVLHPCRSDLDPNYASCAVLFEDSDIKEVASEAGLQVTEIVDDLSEQRKFVVMKKHNG